MGLNLGFAPRIDCDKIVGRDEEVKELEDLLLPSMNPAD